ncbi:MAG: 30S ribosomal protein S13 [Candidatus Micrarchaeota archaeon]
MAEKDSKEHKKEDKLKNLAKDTARIALEKEIKMARAEKADFKGRLRIAQKEINGHFPLAKAIRQVKGVGMNMSEAVVTIFCEEFPEIKKTEKIGNLSDAQIERIEKIIEEISKYVPKWMLNKLKEPETGKNLHLTSSDLDFYEQQNKKREIGMRSYRGVRHMLGLQVRGQRTKTSGRVGLTLGVQKKKEMPKKAGETKPEKK